MILNYFFKINKKYSKLTNYIFKILIDFATLFVGRLKIIRFVYQSNEWIISQTIFLNTLFCQYPNTLCVVLL